MDRLQQKIEQRNQETLRSKNKKQSEAVKEMLGDDRVSTILRYCKKVFSEPLTESLSEYCPTNLSKFIFEEQLEKAKILFNRLPEKQCRIDHFLLIMVSIMEFPFEKWPYYLVGFRDMFNEIVPQKKNYITFPHFFKYIIGEVLDFKEEQQNTEFQVRFEELKKQDYLMHDNGVRKFYYSTDNKVFMTLDESSYLIKIYNKEMRMINKFTPNKEKHNKKYPNILSFDYSEMSSRLGLALTDNTVSIINFQSFLTKSKHDFESVNSNELVIHFQDKVLKIFYVQMLNRWALLNDNNKMQILDMEKYRQADPDAIVEVKMEDPDLQIGSMLELVNLSMICVVAGNEIYFFNENFSEKKHAKFSHSTNIKILRYSEELANFFICGDEKTVTSFTMIRNSDSFNISSFSPQSKYNISAFEVFPLFNTIVIVDQNHDVRLYDLAQGTCYQQSSYSNIVKNEKNEIKMMKISKSEFALYETYTLVFQKEKIAIEKDAEFLFNKSVYLDTAKEEFYFSVNNQIISFSIPQGEIRKSYNMDTANVPKHDSFMIAKNTNLFLIDSHKNIYEAYLKDSTPDGENKSYKKKIAVKSLVASFYDEEIRVAFVVGPHSIHTIRNDGGNNFTVTSTMSLEKFPDIISAVYNSHVKEVSVLFQTQKWAIIDIEKYVIKEMYSLNFPKDPNSHEDIMIIQHDHDISHDMDILLTNHNIIYFIEKTNRDNAHALRLADYLPHKLKALEFTSFKYCAYSQIQVLVTDKNGYLLELNITKLIRSKFTPTQRPFKTYYFLVKDLHTVENVGSTESEVDLKKISYHTMDKKAVNLFKGHDKQIQIKERVDIEGMKTLTFSIDGHIKLWQDTDLLFHLKLPDLKKLVWNMEGIEKVKNERSVNEMMKLLEEIEDHCKEKASPQLLLKISNRKKNKEDNLLKEVKQFSLDEPIPVDIEKKDIEEIVQRTHNINWYSEKNQLKKKDKEMSFTQRVNPHPWRTKNSFLKIMEKASPENKYSKKMPRDLVYLRNSLDMRNKRENREEQKSELHILPELKQYLSEKKKEKEKKESKSKIENKVIEEENEETFESCLYVKNNKNRKKINEFDEIDKQFKKKWLALTAKKFVPKNDSKKKSQSESKNKNKIESYMYPVKEFKYDPIKEVKSIFEEHNRQTSNTKKGRFIKIPNINLSRDELFSND